MKRVWLVGPISWDTVIEIDSYPANGGFAQGKNRRERPGGSASNTAIALASAGLDSNFISFVGDDEIGRNLLSNLKTFPGLNSHISKLPGPSLHAIITVDSSGERTVFALETNRIFEIDFNYDFDSNDIVCFPVWRDFYLPWLKRAKSQGALTVTGIGSLRNKEVSADLAIGSNSDLVEGEIEFNQISKVIMTKGGEGSLLLDASSKVSVSAYPAEVKDATGAGDAYLAGVLLGIASGKSLEEAMHLGSKWAAAAVEIDSSIPPSWSEVCRRFGI